MWVDRPCHSVARPEEGLWRLEKKSPMFDARIAQAKRQIWTGWSILAYNADTLQVLGTPYCGKGEPSQVIRVGHASPACVFSGVDVFGGDA